MLGPALKRLFDNLDRAPDRSPFEQAVLQELAALDRLQRNRIGPDPSGGADPFEIGASVRSMGSESEPFGPGILRRLSCVKIDCPNKGI